MHGATLAAPHPRSDRARFYRNHLWLPLLAAFILGVILMPLHGDFWVADRLYALQGHAWALRYHRVTEALIHVGGRQASAVAWLVVAGAYGWSHFDAGLARWRRPLAYLAITTLLAAALVGIAKAFTGMDCPWDLVRYGGDRQFISLFEHRPQAMPRGSCFPSGHASSGYAWMALYFFFLVLRPRLRWWGLAVSLVAGATFGLSQQLRGAHFVSHDLWTLMVCWLTALGSYLLAFKPLPSSSSASSGAGGAEL